MFDPAVYENLKIILEGMVYDKDLDGDWIVINRNDLVDLAHMSRTYKISVRNTNLTKPSGSCTFQLTGHLQAFALEKLPQVTRKKPGCYLSLHIQTPEDEQPLRLIHELKKRWDAGHIYDAFKTSPFGAGTSKASITIDIQRNQPIYEDDAELMQSYVQEIYKLLFECY